ncbi:hypothetical protein SCHPADRAFT_946505 [Schizopora paradoxa]|uniref:Calcium permease n=1 Tax=Schizopora paradoxa TaxID=27342 RepID=A0A0H2RM79_9AGAM|nr:hypothetical protein SCHPADRAFT_946505 [Schizopora paradoxa]
MSNVADRDTGGRHYSPSQTPTRGPLHRNTSVSSNWSTDTGHYRHDQGSSYFPAVSPTPRRPPHRSNSNARSVSMSSERVVDEDDGAFTGDDNSGEDSPSPGEQGNADTEAATTERQYTEDDPLTVKDRQSLMNVDHPFGLPIWKPALYKKSRSVNRNAETALHATPTQKEGLFHPGNIFWTLAFGLWLGAICMLVSLVLFLVPWGGRRYSPLVFGLGWYLIWPFGKYVEGTEAKDDDDSDGAATPTRRSHMDSVRAIRRIDENEEVDENETTPRVNSPFGTITQRDIPVSQASWRDIDEFTERSHLKNSTIRSYGTTPPVESDPSNPSKSSGGDILGKIIFWLFLLSIIAPLMLCVCLLCWFLVVTIPMAKLNWALIKHLFQRPNSIRFCSRPPPVVFSSQPSSQSTDDAQDETEQTPTFTIKRARLSAGQAAPSGSPDSTVLLCTYRAVGLQYYKYTVGGVNIFFVNLMAVVFFAIADAFILLPIKDEIENSGRTPPFVLQLVASRLTIFVISLASVIPLSYFIGMAVASISAQSSIGMGAVINATFGSIIEIILYGIALTEEKGRLVEGSIVGSLLAGVLLMPGASMCSGALKKKEQKFNAKSASVTSTMLIMAIIGTLTPTLFYQTYGSFELVCDETLGSDKSRQRPAWIRDNCYYEHPDPANDPFYRSSVKSLSYFCAVILLLSYLIGLWFSLRTHASQIWQNPQQLMHPIDLSVPSRQGRMSIYNRLMQSGLTSSLPTYRLNRKPSDITAPTSRAQSPIPRDSASDQRSAPKHISIALPPQPRSPTTERRNAQMGLQTPFMESVNHAVKTSAPVALPEHLTTDDFTRAVAVATVSALRHQQAYPHSPARLRGSGVADGPEDGAGGHGHDAPSWSRTTSASVLLACTALYAIIAVDVVLEGSGIDEKFLGVTLFALVPNTTEFMNAMSFAMNGNIALSMEIGSAYALQVCLLQIPAMVAFSAWYNPKAMGTIADTFTLIFPRWDVICIILSVFLMTYTYIEAKSNYHRGSMLILSYLVLLAGFYFSPHRPEGGEAEVYTTLSQTFFSTINRIVQLV